MFIQGWTFGRILRAPEAGAGAGGGDDAGQQGGDGGGQQGILNTAGQQGNGQQGGGQPPAGVYEQMSAEHRMALAAKNWKSTDDVARDYLQLESKLGEKGLPIPRPDAPPERWDEFYNTLGRPEAADKYNLPKPPDGVPADPKREAWFRDAAHKHGLTQKQAESLYADFYENTKATMQEIRDAVSKVNEGLKTQWGGEYDANLSHANFAFGKAFGDQVEAIQGITTAEGMPITGHPLIVQGFAAIGKMLAEGGQGPANLFGPGGTVIATAADAKREIARIKADPDMRTALLDSGHAEHQAVVDKMNRLNGIIRAAGVPD